METTKRSVLKAVLWNALGLASMTLTGFMLTGSATVGGVLALVNTAIGFVVYLVYERVWAQIRWGRHA